MNFDFSQLTGLSEIVLRLASTYLPPIFKAILMLRIGFKAIGWVTRFTTKALKKTKIDTTISKFVANLVSITLKIFLLISVAGLFGIQTTSFIALIGAAGLAIGMSLQGSLSNFAGGVLILLFKPYEVGNLIEAQGIKGHVAEIGVFTTAITTLENNTAIVPNGPIINNNIINFSSRDSIRVDVHVGIAYDEDIDNARKVLTQVIEGNELILQDHNGNGIFVNELADSSVNLIVRGYTEPEHYRTVYFAMTEASKKALDKAGISIPFPHRVIHTVSE